MIFEWPMMLWLLAVVPFLVAGYRLVLDRKKQVALSYAKWTTAAAEPPSRLKQTLPPALFLVAVVALIAALARPVAVIPVPTLQDNVILAIDVSNSMLAEDLAPTRLAAAQTAARAFIEEQPLTTRIGVVAFAETALLIQRPTDNREDLMKAVDRLKPQEGTAVGGAILVGLQALFPKEAFELERAADPDMRDEPDEPRPGEPPPAPPRAKQAPGSEDSSAIVLLTDGQATSGPDPIKAAEIAADRGVRLFTIGIGTEQGAVVKVEGVSMRVNLDVETLRKIADITLGRMFLAADAKDLTEVYRNLNTRLITEIKETEITTAFIALAALSILLGAVLSLVWFNRIL
jgi:Ca-activated chloride channel family protein